ncbi:uncharacterized protein FIBRA_08123 [Fibroporia radiculosa]|uniref:Uncharacterized protein n=1 Tax=Fibroporia radiculosa TaxID=599839 RepID=J4IC68_9APHY|nr:uncharacterized protein FIBRA_08123 [Fibroporia radiculosa]CCM05886.1 predicted protein [Fibroporia radiculosa]
MSDYFTRTSEDMIDAPPPAYGPASVHTPSTILSVDTSTQSRPSSSTISLYSPISDAGTSSIHSAESVGTRFAHSESVASIFKSSPPCFQRSPPTSLPYPSFEPIVLYALCNELQKGFPPIPPASMASPHPFATHDISEEDWLRFLQDVKAGGALAPVSKIVSAVAPMARCIPLPLAGMLVSKGVSLHMKSRKRGPVGEVLEHWNRHFFHRRMVHIVLAQGKISYSGPEALPPDMVRAKSGLKTSTREYSDDESEDDDAASIIVDEALQKGGDWVAAYKNQKKRRRDWSRSTEEKWRLVVTFRDFVL